MAKFDVKFKKNGAPRKTEKQLVAELNQMISNIVKGEHKGELAKLREEGKLRPRTAEELEALKNTLLPLNNKSVAQVQQTSESSSSSNANENNSSSVTNETANVSGQDNAGEEKIEKIASSDWANQFSDEIKNNNYSPINRRVIPKEYAGKNILSEISNENEKKEQQNLTGDQTNQPVTTTTEPVQQPQQTQPVKKVMKEIPTLEDHLKQNQQQSGGMNNIMGPKDDKADPNANKTATTNTPAVTQTTNPPVSSNMKDLPEDKKRKYAEKTAESMLNSYGKFIRSKLNPLKNWALIDMDKVKHKAMQGKLDLDIKLKLGNGTQTNIKQYLDERNHQVNTVFVLTPEAKRDIKEPLVDVLIENNFMLTPTQRLILAMGEHVGGMIQASYQFAQQNKVDMQAFERYHKERMQNSMPPVNDEPDPANQQEQNNKEEKISEKETTEAPDDNKEKADESSVTNVKDFLAQQASKKSGIKKTTKKPVKKNKNGRR